MASTALHIKFAVGDTQQLTKRAKPRRDKFFTIYDEESELEDTQKDIPYGVSTPQDRKSLGISALSENINSTSRATQLLSIPDVRNYYSDSSKVRRVASSSPRAIAKGPRHLCRKTEDARHRDYGGANGDRSVSRQHWKPLRPCTRAIQSTTSSFDRPGRPTGKENLIPTYGLKEPQLAIESSECSGSTLNTKAQVQHTSWYRQDVVNLSHDRPLKGSKISNKPSVGRLERNNSGNSSNDRPHIPQTGSSIRSGSLELTTVDESRSWRDTWLTSQESRLTDSLNKLFAARSEGQQKPDPQNIRSKLAALYKEKRMPQLERRLEASLRFGALAPSNIQNKDLEIADVAVHDHFNRVWIQIYDTSVLCAAINVVRLTGTDRVFKSQPESPRKLIDEYILQTHEARIKEREGINQAASRSWHHAIIKSLMIIFLLDQAGTLGLLQIPIFKKRSPVKASCEILEKTNALLGSGCANLGRKLVRLGYRLGYVQEPISKYDYAVTNLAVDLRDGVRLARLVDQIHGGLDSVGAFQPGRLSRKLKIPATRKSERLCNLQIVLDHLKQAWGADLLQGVTATDLVEGHREVTLALVWTLTFVLDGENTLLARDEIRGEVERLAREFGKPFALPMMNELIIEAREATDELVRIWSTLAAYQIEPPANQLREPGLIDGILVKRLVDAYCPLQPARYGLDNPWSSVADGLKSLGFGVTFANFFGHAETIIHTVKPELQIVLLAFLCSQLLSATKDFRDKRERLKQVAENCKVVVDARKRATDAAVIVQRAWRKTRGQISAVSEASHVDIWFS